MKRTMDNLRCKIIVALSIQKSPPQARKKCILWVPQTISKWNARRRRENYDFRGSHTRISKGGMPAAGEKIMISVDHTHESARGECPPQARKFCIP